MKLSEAVQILEIRNQLQNQKLPIKTSYKFTRFFTQLDEEVKFFNETLQKIVEEYGERDENGNYVLTEDKTSVKIQPSKFSECINKIEELNNVEVNISYVPIFELSELESLELEMKYLNLLLPYIKED